MQVSELQVCNPDKPFKQWARAARIIFLRCIAVVSPMAVILDLRLHQHDVVLEVNNMKYELTSIFHMISNLRRAPLYPDAGHEQRSKEA